MAEPPRRPRGTTLLGWMRRIAAIALLLGAASWFVRAVDSAREAARRSACCGHLYYLAFALRNYHEVYDSYPPAVVHGPDGKPWHSWRTLILPYADDALARSYRMDEPWDGPNNRRLVGQMPGSFACPTAQDTNKPLRHTNYVAIVGPGTCFPPGGTVRLDDITDGPSRTLLLAEIPDSTVPWTAPVDLDLSSLLDQATLPRPSAHRLGRPFAFVERRAVFLPSPIDPDTLRALATIAGGEPVPLDLPGD